LVDWFEENKKKCEWVEIIVDENNTTCEGNSAGDRVKDDVFWLFEGRRGCGKNNALLFNLTCASIALY
jgi:hypothetical protein